MMIHIVIVWCVKCQKEVENVENDLLKSVFLFTTQPTSQTVKEKPENSHIRNLELSILDFCGGGWMEDGGWLDGWMEYCIFIRFLSSLSGTPCCMSLFMLSVCVIDKLFTK